MKMLFMLTLVSVLLAACASQPTASPASAIIPTITSLPPTSVIASDVWDEFLLATPYPHEFALPAPASSALDGTFAKLDESPPQFWTCYRCADYRPTGGLWKLQFDRGVMRIFYQITNWKSIASFTVEGNRVKIFNDPFCPHEVGEYEWDIEDGGLTLTAIKDGCAANLRKENLTKQTWKSCETNTQQVGCTNPSVLLGDTPSELPVTVTIHAGDSHYFKLRPAVFAAANPENVPSPDGIVIRYSSDSIPYGTHRVLWWKGNWMEATTETPFTSIGVQFWGSGYLGWARVLFDGVEVWRGLTTALGKSLAYYGGYIEISGFEPGEHTLRVENLGFDYRPVKVYAFGFSNQPVQK